MGQMKLLMGGDFHFRTKAPEARLDDYIETQDKLIKWLKSFEDTHIFINSGDLVHLSRERADALGFANYLLMNLPDIYGVLGNHDLLNHSLNPESINKTTMGILINAGKFKPIKEMSFDNVVIRGFHYGEKIENVTRRKDSKVYIAVYHGMVMEEPNDFYDGLIAEDMLDDYPGYDIILTGDNHKSFIVEKEGRVLINPGSLKRDTASQIEHVPYLYSFDPATLKLDKIKVPIEDDIISREHIEVEKERDTRIEELSAKFVEVRDATLDYEENMHNFLRENTVNESVDRLLMHWLSKE